MRKSNILVILFFIFGLAKLSYCNDSSDVLPDLCVTGIFKSSRPMIIVNETILKKGDVIKGAKIIDIGNSYVKFEYNGVTFTRELGEGVKPKENTTKKEITQDKSQSRKDWLNDYSTPYGKELYNATIKNYKKAIDEEGKNMTGKAFIHYGATLKYAQLADPLVSSGQRSELNNLVEICRNKINLLGEEKQKMSGILDSLDLNSPQAISQWLGNNITYESDVSMYGEGYWQTPKETMILKTGDCEDFAFLAQAFLKKINISSDVLSIKYKKDNQTQVHAICIFIDKGYYNFFSNSNLRISKKTSKRDLIDKAYPNWISVEELELDRYSWITLFER